MRGCHNPRVSSGAQCLLADPQTAAADRRTDTQTDGQAALWAVMAVQRSQSPDRWIHALTGSGLCSLSSSESPTGPGFKPHCTKNVSFALPTVDNRGTRTPAHVQLKRKKLQLQNERLSTIDRDNRLLASRLTSIVSSKGLVDQHNQYHLRSLNIDKRREELLLISRQNQAIYQRLTSRQSEYRRQLWLDDWERAERLRDNIAQYPRGLADKQRSNRKVKFAAVRDSEWSASSSKADTEESN
ncbi:uncharacterized protein si:ch211-284k5.2 isoform X1 [Solea solea]|uniref:uncharacterized protein si:ch211-284k5.2 isoform X1 n=1 Tax=Solea solea TaxID=90069 RepID=UPI0027295390|nr:uncharacterized protein si:ch211-284k5.2 isoform X1 [Solea solea]